MVDQIELFCSNLNLAVQKLSKQQLTVVLKYKQRFFRDELILSSSFGIISPVSTNLPSVSSPSCDHIKISNLHSKAYGISTE